MLLPDRSLNLQAAKLPRQCLLSWCSEVHQTPTVEWHNTMTCCIPVSKLTKVSRPLSTSLTLLNYSSFNFVYPKRWHANSIACSINEYYLITVFLKLADSASSGVTSNKRFVCHSCCVFRAGKMVFFGPSHHILLQSDGWNNQDVCF